MNADNQWQLAGTAAELYQELLVPTVFKPWGTDLVELADLRQGERVLDVACGTGVVARLAAQQVGATGEVTGLDLNAGMLRVARSLPSLPGAPVTWVEGSALAMPLPDGSFDVVLCQQGVQFFPDQRAGLQEFKRVLVPRGRVLFSVWEGGDSVHRCYGDCRGATCGARGRDDPPEEPRLPGSGDPTVFDEADWGFRKTTIRARTIMRRLPAIAVFVLRHLSATPVAGAIAALSEGARMRLADEVRAALQAYEDGDGVALREVANVVIAVR